MSMNIESISQLFYDNPTHVNEHNLRKLYKDFAVKKIHHDFGVDIDAENINSRESVMENYQAFIKANIPSKFKDLSELRIYQSFSGRCYRGIREIVPGKTLKLSTYTGVSLNMAEIVQIILFSVRGKLIEYREAMEYSDVFRKKEGVKYSDFYDYTDFGIDLLKVNNIRVKKYKNGNFDIQGFTPEMEKNIVYLQGLLRK